MREFFSRRGKLIALVVGFLFSTVGALWALLVTDRLDTRIQKLGEEKSTITRQITELNRYAAEYFMLNQQGDLIYLLKVQSEARELAANIYRGNLSDRSVPVTNMINELGQERQLDADETNAEYRRISDVLLADPNDEGKWLDVKIFEKKTIKHGQQRALELVTAGNDIDRQLRSAQSTQSLNHIMAVLTAIMGSAVLVAANVIAEKTGDAEPSQPRG